MIGGLSYEAFSEPGIWNGPAGGCGGRVTMEFGEEPSRAEQPLLVA